MLVGLAIVVFLAAVYFYIRTLAPAYTAEGTQLTAAGNFQEADQLFRRAGLAGDDSEEWFAEYGRLKIFLADQKGYDEDALRQAADFLADGVGRYPDCAECWKLLGNTYLDIGEYENARAAAEQAIALGADDGISRRVLALALFSLGRSDDALAVLRPATEAAYIARDRSLSIEADNFYLTSIPAIALNTYGWLVGQGGDLRGALGYFERALEIDPRFYAAACNAAVVRYRLNDFSPSELERLLLIAQATDSNVECDFIDAGLGIAYARMGDTAKARAHLDAYLRSAPQGRWATAVQQAMQSL